MRMYDIIKKKRDGFALSREEIAFFIKGYTNGSIPDEQASALAMAIWFCGMNDEETACLTQEITASGDVIDLSGIDGFKVDKHSSGGVGDKTTLIVAPIVSAAGVKVAKMSGRGLGHTGGTIDKLESIPGFQTWVPREKFIKIVNEIGICVASQSGELAPADKKLYALRDETATVDSLPLIASSIMGKKLASGADGIVLDVKVGSGSFNKTYEDGLALAKAMVSIGTRAGKRVTAILSDMDEPLGRAVGNSLELIEAIDVLKGSGDARLRRLCLALAANMLFLADKGTLTECERLAEAQISSGSALQRLKDMVRAQGGDTAFIDDPSRFPKGKEHGVFAPCDGYITKIDTERYGTAALLLGAGRNLKEDAIDHSAGIIVHKKKGDAVKEGELIATLYASDETRFEAAKATLLSALSVTDEIQEKQDVILGLVDEQSVKETR